MARSRGSAHFPPVSAAGAHRRAPGRHAACAAWPCQEARGPGAIQGLCPCLPGASAGGLHTSGGGAAPGLSGAGPQHGRVQALPSPPAPPPSQRPKEDRGLCSVGRSRALRGPDTPNTVPHTLYLPPALAGPAPPSPGHARASRAMAAMMPERTEALPSRPFLLGGHRPRSSAPTQTRGPSPHALP